MTARALLKNFAAWLDGHGYAGNVESYEPPALNLLTEEFRAGGMDAAIAIETGMERLQAKLVLTELSTEAAARFGLTKNGRTQLTVRGSVEDADGTVHADMHSMRGLVTSVTITTYQPGSVPKLEITLSLDYFRHERDGRIATEIDVINMRRVINGVDQLAARREALGI